MVGNEENVGNNAGRPSINVNAGLSPPKKKSKPSNSARIADEDDAIVSPNDDEDDFNFQETYPHVVIKDEDNEEDGEKADAVISTTATAADNLYEQGGGAAGQNLRQAHFVALIEGPAGAFINNPGVFNNPKFDKTNVADIMPPKDELMGWTHEIYMKLSPHDQKRAKFFGRPAQPHVLFLLADVQAMHGTECDPCSLTEEQLYAVVPSGKYTTQQTGQNSLLAAIGCCTRKICEIERVGIIREFVVVRWNPGRAGTPWWSDIVVCKNGPQIVAEVKAKHDNMGVYDHETGTRRPSKGSPAYQWTQEQYDMMKIEVKKSSSNRLTLRALLAQLNAEFPDAVVKFATLQRQLKRMGW